MGLGGPENARPNQMAFHRHHHAITTVTTTSQFAKAGKLIMKQICLNIIQVHEMYTWLGYWLLLDSVDICARFGTIMILFPMDNGGKNPNQSSSREIGWFQRNKPLIDLSVFLLDRSANARASEEIQTRGHYLWFNFGTAHRVPIRQERNSEGLRVHKVCGRPVLYAHILPFVGSLHSTSAYHSVIWSMI